MSLVASLNGQRGKSYGVSEYLQQCALRSLLLYLRSMPSITSPIP